MERIKLIALAILIMCSTIFVSSFFYLSPLSKEDTYEHMNEQFQDIFQAINLSLESNFITQEEFDQSISSDTLKERVQDFFRTIESDSLYTYSEETVSEVSSSVGIIYDKELKRIEQEDAKAALLWIKLLSASACLLTFGILFILYKKKKALLKINQNKGNVVEEEKISTKDSTNEGAEVISSPQDTKIDVAQEEQSINKKEKTLEENSKEEN